ncbi:hypothetical protein OIK40_03945 [Erythrobacter sp. sf7]|uniref:Uncharacterized protein n=1 Tax=Erythrobacter fulvus TaxID=2987523 RepID=A0ABT5JNZ9_9SPHN|nr:hypothetical protein [Erythrobacter fulvus]MDC8753791.1 hypothetical protein [Erythrobacter fulvus]
MKNPLLDLPLIEPPLFSRLLLKLGLSEEEVRIWLELFERGYAVLDFPEPEPDQSIDRIKANLGPRFAIDFDDHEAGKTCREKRIQEPVALQAGSSVSAAQSLPKLHPTPKQRMRYSEAPPM